MWNVISVKKPRTIVKERRLFARQRSAEVSIQVSAAEENSRQTKTPKSRCYRKETSRASTLQSPRGRITTTQLRQAEKDSWRWLYALMWPTGTNRYSVPTDIPTTRLTSTKESQNSPNISLFHTAQNENVVGIVIAINTAQMKHRFLLHSNPSYRIIHLATESRAMENIGKNRPWLQFSADE